MIYQPPISKVYLIFFNIDIYLWKFSKCHSLVGVQSPGKWTKYQALPELIWWLPELIFQFLPYWFSFPMTYINKCLSAAAASHVSDSAVVFVTCTALLHSPLFIALIPHFNSYFVMYLVSTMTADNWNKRNKCYHPHSQLTISDNWLNSPPEMKMRLGFGFECWSRVQVSQDETKPNL